MGYFRKEGLSHETKAGRANIVTEADVASQKWLVRGLSRLCPHIPIIGEEGRQQGWPEKGFYFLVDPLDGTLNFLHGIPFFSVSIAVMWGTKPVAGVVHAPALRESFYAVEGQGAYFNNRKISLQSKTNIREAIAVTGWPYNSELIPWTQRALLLVHKEAQEVRILGSASLEMCYVAAKIVDVYWEIGLYPWDLAAGWAILRESGGIVSDIAGGDFDLLSGRVLACGNESLHREMVRLLNSSR